MQHNGSFTSDQQLQDLFLLSHKQREHQLVPRVDSVRCTRSSVMSIELTFLQQHPEALVGCERAITLAIRLPNAFPLESPMIACVAGGECLPDSLCVDGQLRLPWLRDGWPLGYTLDQCARDICTRLSNASSRPSDASALPADPASSLVHPLPLRRPPPPPLMLLDSPPKPPKPSLLPSAPTYYGDQDNQVSLLDGSPLSPSRRSLSFKCKWRDTQCQFQANAPQSLHALMSLLGQYIPSLAGHKNLRLAEFNSTRSGALLTCDQDWQRLVKGDSPTIFLLIHEVSPKPSDVSIDLLGLDDHDPIIACPQSLRSPRSPSRAVARSPPKQPQEPSHLHLRRDSTSSSSVRRIAWTDLEIGKIIGNGSSCRVYKAMWRGTEVAVKVFTGTNRAAVEKEFTNEVETMARLGAHPSLVLFLAVTEQPLSIVFEYLPFSLFELINGVEDVTRKMPLFPASWTKRVTMMLDVARGLQFLHSFDIIHRDMKSLNLLVTPEGRVKLADFGISRVAKQSDVMTGCCGTFQWMAPEVLQSAAYSVSADIYSFGIIMWEICEAAPPFADLAPAMVPVAVLRDKKRPVFSPSTPPQLQALISRCWQEDASKRPSAASIVTTLQGFFHAA